MDNIMAIKRLSELDDYKLADSEQDCRGWHVVNALGIQIGTVREMLVDKERERVSALVLDSGVQIAADEVWLRDGRVVTARTDLAVASDTAAGSTR
jgi:sporulation protein YlmC with PRC-barrel domain